MCAGLGDTSPEGTASDCTSLAHADSIDADSIYTSPSQKNESASTLIPKHQKSPMALYMDSLGLINIAELDNFFMTTCPKPICILMRRMPS